MPAFQRSELVPELATALAGIVFVVIEKGLRKGNPRTGRLNRCQRNTVVQVVLEAMVVKQHFNFYQYSCKELTLAGNLKP